MEVECEMEIPEDESLVTLWIQENNAVVKRWKDFKTTGNIQALKQTLLECDSELSLLLQKVQGLPPTANNLPLELTVVYNTLLIRINITGGFLCEHQEQLKNALCRVLVTRSQGEVRETTITELWKKVLAAGHPQDTYSALNRLAGLQGALWLAENLLEPMVNLFHLFNQVRFHQVTGGMSDPTLTYRKCKLLELIKAWKVPQQAEEEIHTLQSVCHLKDMLYTSAAFLQGLASMDAEDFPQAVNLLQKAASSLCTSKILSEIYTCLGWSFYKMAKPQTALQFWKQALSVNFQCLPALYHTSRLYSDMSRMESELEALDLLHTELENHSTMPSLTETLFLFRTELLLSVSILSRYLHVPNSWEVKYLIANHHLRRNSTEHAAEHYMDLMTALLNESQAESMYPSPATLPRIPVIYLEAAAALLETKRFQDAITVSEEVLESLIHITAGIATMAEAETSHESKSYIEKLNSVLWASTAHFLQGEAQGKLGNLKESVTAYTRCINLMMKVQFADSGFFKGNDHIKELKVFTVLKASAFLGRSHQFSQMGDEKSSKMNVRLALQAIQGFPGTFFCLIGLLWKTEHKKEVAHEFRRWRYQGKMEYLLEQYEEIKRYLPVHLIVCIQKSFLLDKSLVQELEDYLQKEEKENTIDSYQNFTKC
ncbi:PREDICTED: Fanconi anemia group G protein [Nanorana parkeri]|uniref:Fanconi anemia group G protein n=1 Tax=Nanorana parkeri TaxID=125878 RepID=UPI000854C5B9|nr:PREDICTED: Fanconi anemia group G protein [Nanorana parkeri]